MTFWRIGVWRSISRRSDGRAAVGEVPMENCDAHKNDRVDGCPICRIHDLAERIAELEAEIAAMDDTIADLEDDLYDALQKGGDS
jgi:hypothetical protein